METNYSGLGFAHSLCQDNNTKGTVQCNAVNAGGSVRTKNLPIVG